MNGQQEIRKAEGDIEKIISDSINILKRDLNSENRKTLDLDNIETLESYILSKKFKNISDFENKLSAYSEPLEPKLKEIVNLFYFRIRINYNNKMKTAIETFKSKLKSK